MKTDLITLLAGWTIDVVHLDILRVFQFTYIFDIRIARHVEVVKQDTVPVSTLFEFSP